MKVYNNAELLDMIKNPKQGLNGVNFLRALVDWLDHRPEHMNENKTADKLLTEFKDAIEPF